MYIFSQEFGAMVTKSIWGAPFLITISLLIIYLAVLSLAKSRKSNRELMGFLVGLLSLFMVVSLSKNASFLLRFLGPAIEIIATTVGAYFVLNGCDRENARFTDILKVGAAVILGVYLYAVALPELTKPMGTIVAGVCQIIIVGAFLVLMVHAAVTASPWVEYEEINDDETV